jgi:hypothetical protein
MISVSLTSNRHIAAATAAYIATIPADPEATPPYASVEAYVQAALERVADSWVESTKVDQISVGEFALRFTGAEFAAITAAAGSDANVAAILANLRARDSVRLGSVDAVNGIAYLIAAGLLTSERGAEVLHYEPQDTRVV